jgi:hypothetical protein
MALVGALICQAAGLFAGGDEIWQSSDIGNVGFSGSSAYQQSDGTFTILGSGHDIWDLNDAFHYVYTELKGDGQIIARVTAVQDTSGWAKAGVMMRESLAVDAKYADMVMTPGAGVSYQWRAEAGGSCGSTQTPDLLAPYWLYKIDDNFL